MIIAARSICGHMPLDYAIQQLPHLVIYEVTGDATLDDMHRLIAADATPA